jgi:L,D-transpeptidase ErfK/SrfK
VRVVNQPFVFGWRDDNLYMQPFDVLEDDTRDWKKAPKKLLSQSLASTLQKELKAHNEQVNWELVSTLAKTPRGVPVSISTADASVEQILAAAPLVQNQVPDGSTWDGKTDLPLDEATFHQMLSEIEPGSDGSSPANGATPPDGKAPAAAKLNKKGS